MNKNQKLNSILLLLFGLFIGLSYILPLEEGKECAVSFGKVSIQMLKILPFAFVIIALIEVWVDDKTIIKYLGKESGTIAYLWIFLLASISIGGIYTALPLSQTLEKKGASLPIIFTYLGLVGVVRIPMTIFEISFLGIPFTIARLMVCIPVFLVFGILIGKYLESRKYKLK